MVQMIWKIMQTFGKLKTKYRNGNWMRNGFTDFNNGALMFCSRNSQ